MAIIKSTKMIEVRTSINTDEFTKEEWRNFIVNHVPAQLLQRIINEGPRETALQRLKEKAIERAMLPPFDIEKWL